MRPRTQFVVVVEKRQRIENHLSIIWRFSKNFVELMRYIARSERVGIGIIMEFETVLLENFDELLGDNAKFEGWALPVETLHHLSPIVRCQRKSIAVFILQRKVVHERKHPKFFEERMGNLATRNALQRTIPHQMLLRP